MMICWTALTCGDQHSCPGLKLRRRGGLGGLALVEDGQMIVGAEQQQPPLEQCQVILGVLLHSLTSSGPVVSLTVLADEVYNAHSVIII